MDKKELAKEVKSCLDSLYPETHCFLHYEKDWQLLFAVILSAQATDTSVNQATSVLFAELPELSMYTEENRTIIFDRIRKVGLSRNKTSFLISTAKELLEEYDGKVPEDREALMKLSGVGYKTSGVVLAELYDYPFIPVDTHVFRVSHRIGLVKDSLTPEETEVSLEKVFQKKDCINTHRQLILLGRNICDARNPDCENCPMNTFCRYYKKSK